MVCTLVIDPRAMQDIQEAINYYEEQKTGLGEKFESALNKHLVTLQRNPFFQVRYDNVRCLPLKKYPYMVHFTVDEENMLVTVRAFRSRAAEREKSFIREIQPPLIPLF